MAPRKPKPPLPQPPRGIRQRQLADGSWRVWWEPDARARQAGFKSVQLDAARPSWCEQQAARLNAETGRALNPDRPDRSRGQSVLDLIENYKASRYWQDLRPATQKGYQALLSQIVAKWGSEPVAAFSKPVTATWYEAVARTGKLTLARQLIRMMSILFSRAEVIGWRAEGSNPCFKLKMKTPEPRSRRIGWADLDALVATADRLGHPSIGTAVLLLTLQGQRATDVRTGRLSDFRLVSLADGQAPVWVWSFRQSKRGKPVALPLHPEVEARLRPRLLRPAEEADALVCPRPGSGDREYSEDLFIKTFNRVRTATGRKAVQGIQMRDLRRTFGILARAGGASREDTGDALGNTAGRDPALYDVYMPATVHTAARAVRAVQRPTKGKKE